MTKAWRNRSEAGVSMGLRVTAWTALHLNRFSLTVLLNLIALYFLLVRGAERRASRDFLSRVFNRRASLAQVYRHFRTFARVTADRVFFLSGKLDRVQPMIHGWDIMERFVQEKRGCVMLGSHLGSFEAARAASIQHRGVTVRMVLDRTVSRKLNKQLVSINPEFGSLVIDADQPAASLGLEIAETLGRGESVGFLSDRHRAGDRVVTCEFMGRPAQFPAGPLIIAAALKAPVVMLFSTYIDGRYEVTCEEFSDAFELPRADRERALQENVQRFASRLAFYVGKAPYNWFNFYDFWAIDPL
jgi:predicted LPLAT superfamily acyltransferase